MAREKIAYYKMQSKQGNIAIVLFYCFTILLMPAFAQENRESYRRFKVYVDAGITHPLLDNISKGNCVSIEPKYVIKNRWQIGCRWEHAHIGPYNEFNYLTSFSVAADWFANTNQLRPFFGVGLGSFKTSLVQEGMSAWHWYTPAGITWRTGLEFRHIRTSIEANILNKSSGFVFDYLGLKLGGYISFGRKSKR